MNIESRFFAKTEADPNSGCLLWTGGGDRYGVFKVGRKSISAHRFSWQLANGRAVPDGLLVRHKCDTGLCVNPEHLLIGTAKENTADMFERGRARPQNGENNPRSKLTTSQVLEIKRLLENGGLLHREIGKMFGVSRGIVGLIKNGKRWAEVAI